MGGSLLLAMSGRTPENLSIFDPVSPQAESIRNLSILVFTITGIIFVIVETVLFYSLVRFRRTTTAGTSEPPQVYGSKPIEIAWTAAPAMIVFILVLVTTRTLWEVNVDLPEPKTGDHTLFVTVVGKQWWWEYTYDHYDGQKLGFVAANELHVPASTDQVRRPIYLTLKSADVCHSFWVPRLAGKTDLIPGKTNHMRFETDKLDLYLGQCAEYCGTQHANMLLSVKVESPQEFEQWLENQRKPARDDPKVRDGKVAFLAQSCINCHRVDGTPAQGRYAPDLTHLMSRQTLAAGMIPNNHKNLDEWVKDPQQIKPGCLMPAFGLSEHDRNLIVRYLESLE
jgi:cytochrome c oxidase subunit 2